MDPLPFSLSVCATRMRRQGCTGVFGAEFFFSREWETFSRVKLYAYFDFLAPCSSRSDQASDPEGFSGGRGLMHHGNPRQARGFLIPLVSRRIECGSRWTRVHFYRVLFYSERLIIPSHMAQFSFTA